ncbi:hypothetical protein BDS110ZK12_13710 [Bradyrhizobium diazoefficiens]|uniref:Uncharacterized protein n=1 Tax=Bradyrhizobium diazoefficiens TaxID=1355477 RepID=A0A809YYJ2_9BRAD|nr:hypothetical protein H12S4_06750 [Bradyrhizobium diazoefficiens]BCE26901.1 hypothetical protein XF2B_06700 [Bradyrhizobium diazoefficiens]BCE44325.1 hypothetical protein XF4B_06740 [Bradyrhizobium diazoefficiens]BCE79273.1 hypothetical protein XF9B_06940 [Bradyrhizobium diazoefficiens]BCF13979.1 hypothetical protein XF13B_06700 [Bradyrhizobium diazoefficiens]
MFSRVAGLSVAPHGTLVSQDCGGAASHARPVAQAAGFDAVCHLPAFALQSAGLMRPAKAAGPEPLAL